MPKKKKKKKKNQYVSIQQTTNNGAANLQSGEDLPCHRSVQGIELLGSVQLDQSHAVEGTEQNVIGLVAFTGSAELCHCRHLQKISFKIQAKCQLQSVQPVHTLAGAPKAGLVTLARRGIVVMDGEAREIQLDGVGNREKPCRSNIKTGQKRRTRRKRKEETEKKRGGREVYRTLGWFVSCSPLAFTEIQTSEFFALMIFLRRKSDTAGRTTECHQHHFRGYCRCY